MAVLVSYRPPAHYLGWVPSASFFFFIYFSKLVLPRTTTAAASPRPSSRPRPPRPADPRARARRERRPPSTNAGPAGPRSWSSRRQPRPFVARRRRGDSAAASSLRLRPCRAPPVLVVHRRIYESGAAPKTEKRRRGSAAAFAFAAIAFFRAASSSMALAAAAARSSFLTAPLAFVTALAASSWRRPSSGSSSRPSPRAWAPGLLGFLLGRRPLLGRGRSRRAPRRAPGPHDRGRGSAAGTGVAAGCARTTTPFLQAPLAQRSGPSRASRAAPAFAVKPGVTDADGVPPRRAALRDGAGREAGTPRSPVRPPQRVVVSKLLRPRVVAAIRRVRGAEPLVADRAPENVRRGPHGPVDLLPGHARRVQLADVLREGPPFFNRLVAQAEVPPPIDPRRRLRTG